jgi:hypothetical protein
VGGSYSRPARLADQLTEVSEVAAEPIGEGDELVVVVELGWHHGS